jgi:hypothetical protein
MAWKIGSERLVRQVSAFAVAFVLAASAANAAAAPSRQNAKSKATAAVTARLPAKPRPPAKPKAPGKPPKPTVASPTPPKRPALNPEGSAPAEAPVSPPAAVTPASDVVKTEADSAGEKTYTFGAQEVEGRLKSPQMLYFLRRVRAQFDPTLLGHRSFLLELSDTRRHPAFE